MDSKIIKLIIIFIFISFKAYAVDFNGKFIQGHFIVGKTDPGVKISIDKKKVEVNTENFETNINGIFAIGDICSYPGKLKLILSGFHEGALAARGCFKYAKPDEKLRFEFTTTSKAAQERLGIKND